MDSKPVFLLVLLMFVPLRGFAQSFNFAVDSLRVDGNIPAGYFEDFNNPTPAPTTSPTPQIFCPDAPSSVSQGFLHLTSGGANTFSSGVLVAHCHLGLQAPPFRLNRGSGNSVITASFRADAPVLGQAYGLQLYTFGTNELVNIQTGGSSGTDTIITALAQSASLSQISQSVRVNLTGFSKIFFRLVYIDDSTPRVTLSYSLVSDLGPFNEIVLPQPGTVMTTGNQAVVSVFGSARCSFADAVRGDGVKTGLLAPHVSPGIIGTSFRPGCGLSLKEAAKLGTQADGKTYDHFNWVQVVTKDDFVTKYSFLDFNLTYCFPGYIDGSWITESCLVVPHVPYIDPPRGGWRYEGASALGPVADNLPWYEDEVYTSPPPPISKADPTHGMCTDLVTNESLVGLHCDDTNATTLGFQDQPNVGLVAEILPLETRFSTTLVGVSSDGTGDALNIAACETGANLTCQNNVGTSFDWHAVGSVVGIIQTRSNADQSSGSGTTVYFDGFKLPGAAGFTRPELELFAKSGINIRDETGVIIPAIIDINPGEFPNNINPQRHGKIPVAIISTTGFHAPDEVDQNSLTFGRTGNEASLAFCRAENVNDHQDGRNDQRDEGRHGDGLMDLVCHFYTSTAGFKSGDTEGILKGKTLSGGSLLGKDSVRIVRREGEKD